MTIYRSAFAIGLTVVVACGQSQHPPPQQQEARPRIGLLMDTLQEERWQRDRDLFLERARELRAEVLCERGVLSWGDGRLPEALSDLDRARVQLVDAQQKYARAAELAARNLLPLSELDAAQIVLLGNKADAGGRYRIGHSVMKDALDIDGIYDAIRNAGLELPARPRAEDLKGRLDRSLRQAFMTTPPAEAPRSGRPGSPRACPRWRSTGPAR